jgi:uncharacterized membrane protein YkvA (DUF1232 family)
MAVRLASWFAKPALLRALLGQARLALRLIREPAVPLVVKTIPVLAASYLVWPLDIVPDLIPVLGQLDDVGVLLAGLELFVRMSPAAPVSHHREAMAAGAKYSPMRGQDRDIDADFTVS